MLTVQDFMAQRIRAAGEGLAKAARETGDRMTWKPLGRGRSALDQVVECGGFNHLGAQILEQGAFPATGFSHEKLIAENDTPEKALTLLAEGTERLARAIASFPPERLEEKITLPLGGGIERSFAEVGAMCHYNTVYHEGQVNYIQTLFEEKAGA